jgi:hypothetical protein
MENPPGEGFQGTVLNGFTGSNEVEEAGGDFLFAQFLLNAERTALVVI